MKTKKSKQVLWEELLIQLGQKQSQTNDATTSLNQSNTGELNLPTVLEPRIIQNLENNHSIVSLSEFAGESTKKLVDFRLTNNDKELVVVLLPGIPEATHHHHTEEAGEHSHEKI